MPLYPYEIRKSLFSFFGFLRDFVTSLSTLDESLSPVIVGHDSCVATWCEMRIANPRLHSKLAHFFGSDWRRRYFLVRHRSPNESGKANGSGSGPATYRDTTPLLNTINFPVHMKNLSMLQLEQLATELREETIHCVSQTGECITRTHGVRAPCSFFYFLSLFGFRFLFPSLSLWGKSLWGGKGWCARLVHDKLWWR